MNAKNALLFTALAASFSFAQTSVTITGTDPVTSTSAGGTLKFTTNNMRIDGRNIQSASQLKLQPFAGTVDMFASQGSGLINFQAAGGPNSDACLIANAPTAGGGGCYLATGSIGPKYNLAVNGDAGVRGNLTVLGSISVGTTGWSISAPDYVFGSGYDLAPLSEVEAFVKSNRHLPGMASARAMEANGSVDLVQMNLDLLKKVEELTLYVIDQDKRIEALHSQIGAKN